MKRATAAAERSAKGLMAVLAKDIFSGITGYFFSGPVEKHDASLSVMGDDTFCEVVKDIFQVLPVGQVVVQ